MSIEVPNKTRQFVQLGCMLTGDGFVKSKPTSLVFAMGKDVGNRKVYGDICKMTHLLVAGASGSGKSVFLRSLIISLIVKYSPQELRLILIDPKKTEFVIYDHLPHLMINEIITDINKVIQSLNWAIGEMNRPLRAVRADEPLGHLRRQYRRIQRKSARRGKRNLRKSSLSWTSLRI